MLEKSKLWLFIPALFGFALLLEISLRLVNPPALRYYRDVKLLHAYHPEYGVTLAPRESRFVRHYADLWMGQFTTNSLGLRGVEEPIPGKEKLLCLGDSLVMGFGVSDSETFCAKLNNQVINGQEYQSLNLGVDAYGSLGSYKRLLDIFPKLDKVKYVLFFISPNDFTMPEELRAQGILPDDENDALHENDPVWQRNFRWQFEATRISYLLQAIKLAWEQTKVKYSITKYGATRDLSLLMQEPITYVKESFFLPIRKEECNTKEYNCPSPLKHLDVTCDDTPIDIQSLQELPQTTQRAYTSLLEYTKKHQIVFIPVILPMQIEEVYCRQLGKFHGLGAYAVRAKLFFQKKGIEVLDLLPQTDQMCGRSFTFRGKEKKADIQDYYIPGDGHLTKLGNQWASEVILQEVNQRKFHAF